MLAGDVKAIAVGQYHNIALTTSGDVLTTGNNDYGQLGDGTSWSKNRFTKVIGTWAVTLGNTLPVRLQQTLALDR